MGLASIVGYLAFVSVSLLFLSVFDVLTWFIALVVVGLPTFVVAVLIVYWRHSRHNRLKLVYSTIEVAETSRSLPTLLSVIQSFAQEDPKRTALGGVIASSIAERTIAEMAEILSDVCVRLEVDERIAFENSLQHEGWGISYPMLPGSTEGTCRFHPPSRPPIAIQSPWFCSHQWQDHVEKMQASFPFEQLDLSSNLLQTAATWLSREDTEPPQRTLSHD